MLYECLKILHIVSAALMLTSLIFCYRLWKNIKTSNQVATVSSRIQTQTWLFIIPFALIQLTTGFTMISVQHYDYSEIWISGSLIGFIVVMGSWFSFIYFLLLSQQLAYKNSPHTTSLKELNFQSYRRVQTCFLLMCAAALLSMVFFMANKSAAIYVNH